MTPIRRSIPALLLSLAVAAACDDGAAPRTASELRLDVADLALEPGDTVRLAAELMDARGRPFIDMRITWASSDTLVVRVDSTGLVRAAGWGEAKVTAAADEATADVDVSVGIRFAAVSAGEFVTCGLSDTGRAYCWGEGHLGVPDTDSSLVPIPVAGDISFASLAVSHSHTCGLTPDGEAYCWGANDEGQLGDGTTEPRTSPVRVDTDLRFVQISIGWGLFTDYTCARTAAGEVWCWGTNDMGEFGDGGASPGSTTPVRGFPGITAVDLTAGGGHTCVLDEEGQAHCVGKNVHGQLGLGYASDPVFEVTPAMGALRFNSIAAGEHDFTCGIATDGRTYCVGHNDNGQLGRGHLSSHELSVEPITLDATLLTVESGIFGACGPADDGNAYCWGLPALVGATGSRVGPTEVPGGHHFVQVSAGMRDHACGIADDGLLYCWGKNGNGRLGDGTTADATQPVRVAFQL